MPEGPEPSVICAHMKLWVCAARPGSLSTCTLVSSPKVKGASSKWSRSRLITGCTACPTRTTLAAMVLRDRSVPPKRPISADWRYSGKPSSYLAVITQARALSVNRPLGMICAGLAATRSALSQHGQAYFTRSWRITRTCWGMMSICSLASMPIGVSRAPSCGQMRSASLNSWRTT